MLFPRNIRVIIEVDGKHHYSDEQGRANAPAYAAMVKADRDLRLVGYDVYRFGGEELTSQSGPAVVTSFFENLLQRYRINASADISRT
jgi:very-short-patch-repair endonuclease